MNRLAAAALATTFVVALTGCSPAHQSGSGSATASGGKSGAAANSADTQGCSWGEITDPTKFTVPARQLDQTVLGVGLDEKGNVGAPPKDQKFAVAWWKGGPKVGSDKGHVILTAHTWQGDTALGNVLNDPEKGLHPGDVIRVSDGTKTVCYTYKESKTIEVAHYDPGSNIWINPQGEPKLTIMICWDYSTSTSEWNKRIVFFADPIK